MKIEEALQYADQWSEGHTFHEGSQGWRAVCATLAAEVRRLQANSEPITLEQIAGLFDGFFEFPTEDRSFVSSVSCKLFARHVAEIVARSGCEHRPLTDEQIKRGKSESDPERQDLCGWSFEMGVAFAEKSHGITG